MAQIEESNKFDEILGNTNLNELDYGREARLVRGVAGHYMYLGS